MVRVVVGVDVVRAMAEGSVVRGIAVGDAVVSVTGAEPETGGKDRGATTGAVVSTGTAEVAGPGGGTSAAGGRDVVVLASGSLKSTGTTGVEPRTCQTTAPPMPTSTVTATTAATAARRRERFSTPVVVAAEGN